MSSIKFQYLIAIDGDSRHRKKRKLCFHDVSKTRTTMKKVYFETINLSKCLWFMSFGQTMMYVVVMFFCEVKKKIKWKKMELIHLFFDWDINIVIFAWLLNDGKNKCLAKILTAFNNKLWPVTVIVKRCNYIKT